MKNKRIFSIIVILFIILSTAGLVFAAGGGNPEEDPVMDPVLMEDLEMALQVLK